MGCFKIRNLSFTRKSLFKADELSYVINNSGAEAIICSKDLEINCLEALKSVDKKIKKYLSMAISMV